MKTGNFALIFLGLIARLPSRSSAVSILEEDTQGALGSKRIAKNIILLKALVGRVFGFRGNRLQMVRL